VHGGQLGRRQAAVLFLLQEFLLALHQLVTQADEIDIALPGLGEEALLGSLLFLYVMADFLAQHGHLGFEELVVGAVRHDVVDQHLGAIVLDEGLVIEAVLDRALTGRVEDFFLDHRVDLQLVADLLGQLPLAVLAAGLLELAEQVLDRAMVVLQQHDGVGKLLFGHGKLLVSPRPVRCSG